MAYLVTYEHPYGNETRLDIVRFVRDLCAELGGAMLPVEDEGKWTWQAGFTLPCGCCVVRGSTLYGRGNGEKASLSIYPTDVPRELDSRFSYDREGRYALPKISVSTTRPIATIAKDVRRRLIETASAAILNRREVARQHREYQSGLAERVAELRSKFPMLEIKIGDDGTTASFRQYNSGNTCSYIEGRVYSSGDVTIDRVGGMRLGSFEAIYRALFMPNE